MMQKMTVVRRFGVLASLTLVSIAWIDFIIFQEPQPLAPQGAPSFSQGLPWLIFAAFLQLIILLRQFRSEITAATRFLSIALATVAFSFFIEPTRLALVLLWPLCMALALSNRRSAEWHSGRLIQASLSCCIGFWLRAVRDFRILRRWRQKHGNNSTSQREILSQWRLPLAGTTAFIFLFSVSNPVFSNALQSLMQSLENIFLPDRYRLLCWIFVGCCSWSIFRARGPARQPNASGQSATPESGSAVTVVRSLVLFNALFAINNFFDLEYLWGGAVLPSGLTYAQYAHQGAYSLVVTTALAAFFIIWAFAEGRPASASALARRLVYVWVAQNILLLASTILRIIRYVQVYALSELRLYVIIWCVVVFCGFCFLVVRLLRCKSNEWLISVNAATALLTLVLCCLLNFGSLISWFNVINSRAFSSEAPVLDDGYLLSLGFSALPAARWYQAQKGRQLTSAGDTLAPGQAYSVEQARFNLEYFEHQLMHETGTWRYNTLRRALLRAGVYSKPQGVAGWLRVLLLT